MSGPVALVAEVAVAAILVVGLLVVTLAVVGVVRLRDAYSRVHAASQAVFFGVVLVLVAAAVHGGGELAVRSGLIGAFLVESTPGSAHAIAWAAWRRRVGLGDAGGVDESGRLGGGGAGADAAAR